MKTHKLSEHVFLYMAAQPIGLGANLHLNSGCVTLNKWLHLSEPHFLHLENVSDKSISAQDYYED
jgi:hypothetical protein